MIEFKKNQILIVNFKCKILEVRASLCGTDKRKWLVLSSCSSFSKFFYWWKFLVNVVHPSFPAWMGFQLSAWFQLPAFQLVGDMVKNGKESLMRDERDGWYAAAREREGELEKYGN